MSAGRVHRPTKTLLNRIEQNMPVKRVWFCGSCGCHDASQDHAPDCVFENRTPRVRVDYKPELGYYVGVCQDCAERTAGSLTAMPGRCGGCDGTNLVEGEIL